MRKRIELCKVCEKQFEVYMSRKPVSYCSIDCKRSDYKTWLASLNRRCVYKKPKKEKIKKIRFKWSEATQEEKIIHLKKIFEKNVIKKDGCWDWSGTIHHGGYTQMKYTEKYLATGGHRISWIIHNGEIPKGQWILHKCDNKKCTNPEHLFLGSARDNVIDKLNKGRANTPHGIGHIHAKLDDEKVREIRKLLAMGVTMPRLSKDFDVSKSVIQAIKYGKTWKHVT